MSPCLKDSTRICFCNRGGTCQYCHLLTIGTVCRITETLKFTIRPIITLDGSNAMIRYNASF